MDTSSSANPDTHSGSPNQRVEGGTPEGEQPSNVAEEYVKSGKQMVLEALGSLYNTAESSNLCLYCGSTQHEHFECDHRDKEVIKNALEKIRACLQEKEPAQAEADEPATDPSDPRQEAAADAEVEEEISDEETDPTVGQMYDSPIYMRLVIEMNLDGDASLVNELINVALRRATKSRRW